MADSPEGDSDHERHDPLVIAASLDLDRTDDARAADEALVATCHRCATLRDDLVMLRAAAKAVPVAPRIRDYRLTAEDAARLRAAPAREPRGATARLTGEMRDPSLDHATHDALLIAGQLDRSAQNAEWERAAELIASCDECAALHDDLVALREATRALSTPTRTLDYRISPADASCLRPGGWRRLLAAIGSSRDLLSRPLAVGLTTIGLAGLLVATVPGVLSGQTGASTAAPALSTVGRALSGAAAAGGAANPESVSESQSSKGAPPAAPTAAESFAAAQLAPTAAPSAAAAAPAPAASAAAQPSDGTYDALIAGPARSSAPGAQAPGPAIPDLGIGDDTSRLAANAPAPPGEHSAMVVLASLLLLAGLSLFGLRWTARRLRDG